MDVAFHYFAWRWGVLSLSSRIGTFFDDANLFLTSRFDAN
jgi:hypothetical protein